MNNKKGDIVIVVFVIMALALTSTVLVMMYLGGKNIKASLQNPEQVSDLYAGSETLNSNIFWILKESMAQSYMEIANSDEYISDSPECMINGQKYFCGLSSNLGNLIQQKVLEKFLIETSTEVNGIKNNLKVDDIDLIFDITKIKGSYDGIFHLSITNNTLIYSSERKDLVLRYEFDITQDMEFEDMGLDSFEKIWEKIELCKPLDFKTCFNLDNFDAEFENINIGGNNLIQITLTSKEKVYIDKEPEKVGFSFLVKT